MTPDEAEEFVEVEELGLGSFPVSSTAFIPNKLDMNESGSWLISRSAMGQIKTSKMQYFKFTHKYDGHHSEDHDCLALAHRLLSLLHGLIGLHNTRLLLLEAEKIVDLSISLSAFQQGP